MTTVITWHSLTIRKSVTVSTTIVMAMLTKTQPSMLKLGMPIRTTTGMVMKPLSGLPVRHQGYVDNDTDCDDTVSHVHPMASKCVMD